MRGKLVLLVGVGIGYVLGARAGRERYEDIKAWARKLWDDPRVQHQVHEAGEFAKDKAPDVVRALADGTKKVVSRTKRNQGGTNSAADASTTATSTSAGRTGGDGAAHADAPQAHD